MAGEREHQWRCPKTAVRMQTQKGGCEGPQVYTTPDPFHSLDPSVAAFGEGASKEVIKVE